ncbi:MAG: TRIC cation channel family protein [Cyanobacteria bacterium]|nr:TRIC cation channel family protein [Cyanobacteriota bacterium]
MVGTAVFAITGVLAVTRRGLDVFGALVLGIVTALGGGTVRDLIIGAPPFWISDFNYVSAASAGALAAFWIGSLFRDAYRGLLYLDALGAALFAITAANKVLSLNLSAPVAVTMGILTGIGGGLIRDVLAGRPTLLMSREIYATPILMGCVAFVLLYGATPPVPYAAAIGFTIIFGVRALAIYRHLEMPAWLTHRDRSDGDR